MVYRKIKVRQLGGAGGAEITGVDLASADDEAIALIAAKKNLRLLLTGGLPDPRAKGLVLRSVAGGFLAQA